MGKGALVFKGDKKKAKKKKRKSKSDLAGTNVAIKQEDDYDGSGAAASMQQKAAAATVSAESAVAPTLLTGTGVITASGTVISGIETQFSKELQNGDAILVSINGTDELRVITMRLSNQSLNVSSAFSESIKNPTAFHYIRKPRDIAKERRDATKKKDELEHQRQTHAFDLYANESLVYREKTETGSYRIKREAISGSGTNQQSRGNLLAMRTKKTSDKYC